jgi:hypothetical protein
MDFRPTSGPHQTNHTEPAAQPVHHQPTAHEPATAHKGDKMLKRQKQLILWLVIAILFITAIGTAAYYVNRYHESQKQVKKLSSNPTLTAQQQQQDLITKVGKLTVLPTGETPTIATVTDITKLKDQPFFANAVNGDKVLIYTQAKKAYLYRPSTNKLINIAPVNLGGNTSATGATTPAATPGTTKK